MVNLNYKLKKKEASKILMLTLFVLFGFQQGYSQDKGVQIGLKGSFLFQGGELSNSYTNLLGAELNYFFKKKEKISYFITSGFSRDLDGTGAALTAIDLGAGIQYNLIKIRNKPLYASLSAGGLYLHEEFSSQLIEGTVQSTFNEFGFKANLGIGYYVFKRVNVQLNITQLHTQGTTVGLSLYYNF